MFTLMMPLLHALVSSFHLGPLCTCRVLVNHEIVLGHILIFQEDLSDSSLLSLFYLFLQPSLGVVV